MMTKDEAGFYTCAGVLPLESPRGELHRVGCSLKAVESSRGVGIAGRIKLMPLLAQEAASRLVPLEASAEGKVDEVSLEPTTVDSGNTSADPRDRGSQYPVPRPATRIRSMFIPYDGSF